MRVVLQCTACRKKAAAETERANMALLKRLQGTKSTLRKSMGAAAPAPGSRSTAAGAAAAATRRPADDAGDTYFDETTGGVADAAATGGAGTSSGAGAAAAAARGVYGATAAAGAGPRKSLGGTAKASGMMVTGGKKVGVPPTRGGRFDIRDVALYACRDDHTLRY